MKKSLRLALGLVLYAMEELWQATNPASPDLSATMAASRSSDTTEPIPASVSTLRSPYSTRHDYAASSATRSAPNGNVRPAPPEPTVTTDPDKRRASLEVDITLAMTTVRAARYAEDHSPNPQTRARTEEAQAELDNLLDLHRRLFGHEAIADQLVKG